MDNSTPSGSSKKIKSGLLKRVRDKILQEVSVDTKTTTDQETSKDKKRTQKTTESGLSREQAKLQASRSDRSNKKKASHRRKKSTVTEDGKTIDESSVKRRTKPRKRTPTEERTHEEDANDRVEKKHNGHGTLRTLACTKFVQIAAPSKPAVSKPKNRRKSQVSVEVLDTEDVESSPAAKSPIKVETNPKGKSAKAEVKRKDNVTPPSSDVASPQISATPSSPVPNSGSQQKLESGNTQPNTASSTEYKMEIKTLSDGTQVKRYVPVITSSEQNKEQ